MIIWSVLIHEVCIGFETYLKNIFKVIRKKTLLIK